MKNKAQGLPLRVIIIAVLLLIVLFVLIAIFTGKVGDFTKGISDCKARGGSCEQGCKENQVPLSGLCPDDKFCCVPIG